VITPNKMVKYYEDVRLSLELYPWSSMSLMVQIDYHIADSDL